MVIVQIWGPWRSLEPLDACAPVSQFQPLHSPLYKVYLPGKKNYVSKRTREETDFTLSELHPALDEAE